MPFSSLTNPSDLARAQAVLESVWAEVKDTVPEADHEKERRRIAYMVAGFVPLALDEEDLRRNVLLHIEQRAKA